MPLVPVDLIGPLPLINGFRYALTIIDRTTRWAEVVPISDLKATTTTGAFISSSSRFGVPKTVTSDRGSQFTSDVWRQSLSRLGIGTAFSTAYHPQSNGIIERFHRSLKNSQRCTASLQNWVEALPWVLLGIRTAPRDDIGNSPAQVLYGTSLRIPGMCFPEHHDYTSPDEEFAAARHNVDKFTPKTLDRSKFKFKPFIPSALKDGPMVFIRIDSINKGPLGPRYSGPHRVLHRNFDRGIFVVNTPNGEDSISIDRLKTANVL